MALSGTMSNPSDWLQFYNVQNNNNNGQSLPFSSGGGLASSGAGMFGHDQAVSHHEATVVTTTTTATASAAAMNPSSSNNTNSLSPEGRVTKPVRKRSRASRRSPTTLLNTDTANFRAMVQQFTGGPSTASFPNQPAGATNFGFGLGARPGFVNPNASLMVPQPGYNHLQLQQQQQNSYLLSLNNNNNGDDHHGFVQRLMSSSSSARPTTNMGVSFSSDEFSSQLQGQQPGLVAGSGRPNSNSSNENRSNSFLY